MSISYRILYESVHGPIPKDEQGRTYHIHHRDGNNANNDINNLQCVSIQEHYDIHYSQGDWAACLRLAAQMEKSPEEISEMARRNAKQKFTDGTHHFLGGTIQRKNSNKRVENRTHHFLDSNKKKQWGQQLIVDGRHISQKKQSCPHCGKTGTGPIMFRWHFDNCKNKRG